MTTQRTKKVLIGAAAALLLVGGASMWYYFATQPTEETASNIVATNTVDTDDGDSDIDWSALPTQEVSLSDETLTITDAGTYVLSGEGTGGVVVNSQGNVRLMLNGVTLSSNDSAAIYVENAETTVIQLASGTNNTVTDAATRTNQDIDGAIFSSDDLVISGEGQLTVNAQFADGISSSDDLKIVSGTIAITSEDDGIRGKDSVYIMGGTITVDAKGDGIKSTNDVDESKGFLYIKDGTVTVSSGDDALKGEQRVVIDGGTITVDESVEGIESANITINGGTVDIYASDDGINAASDISDDLYIKITGGSVKVEVEQGDTDGLDSNGDIIISGGTVDVTQRSSAPATSFDYTGSAQFTGGTIIINGEEVNQIPAEQMGGGPGMR